MGYASLMATLIPNVALLEKWLNLDSEPVEAIIEAAGFESNDLHKLGCPNIAVELDKEYWTLLLSEDARLKAMERRGSGDPSQRYERYVLPGEEKFEQCRVIVDGVRFEHVCFFDWIVEKKSISGVRFNDIVSRNRSVGFSIAGYHALPSIVYSSVPMAIQEYVEIKFILEPAFDVSSRLFELMRRCPICGRLFCGRTQKAVFCSSNCKLKDYRRKKRA